jgi:hypothetical protein
MHHVRKFYFVPASLLVAIFMLPSATTAQETDASQRKQEAKAAAAAQKAAAATSAEKAKADVAIEKAKTVKVAEKARAEAAAERAEAIENMEKDKALALLAFDRTIVKDKPFSADTTTDIVQTLSDGNHIRRHTISKFYRDSSGRTRREQTFGNVDPSNPGPHEVKVFIDDPIANAAYVLERSDNTESAHKFTRSRKFTMTGEKENNPPIRNLPALNEARDIVKEDLGQKTIEGVACTGTKQTITIPAGQIGNDQPIAIVTETWTAPSLGVIVQSTTNDPRYGQTTYQLHNIQLTEQPPSLFEPPTETLRSSH